MKKEDLFKYDISGRYHLSWSELKMMTRESERQFFIDKKLTSELPTAVKVKSSKIKIR